MKDRMLWLCWLYLFILTAALGFIPERNLLVTVLLSLACGAFFVPGGMLLYRAVKRGSRKQLNRIMLLSGLSLLLTTLLIVANMLTVLSSSELLGKVMNAVLVVLSAPMYCAPYYAISLFLWACLLFSCFSYRKDTK
jgi:hypothetical protein